MGGTDVGVDLKSGGVVTNLAGGAITGFYDGVSAAGAALTVTNAGTTQNKGAYSSGVYLGPGGLVTNAAGGTISATSPHPTFPRRHLPRPQRRNPGRQRYRRQRRDHRGHRCHARCKAEARRVLLKDGSTVINQSGGTINGLYGVALPGGGLVINQAGGTIIGDKAFVERLGLHGPEAGIDFGRGAPARLEIDPGAAFIGYVYGDGGTLELAAGASTRTLQAGVANTPASAQFSSTAEWIGC
jgi:hypothetical protein